MRSVSRHVIRHAHLLAREIGARAVLMYAEAVGNDQELRQLLRASDLQTILIARAGVAAPDQLWSSCTSIAVPDVHMTRTGQVKVALLVCLAKGVLEPGDRVVCLTGLDGASAFDTIMVLNLGNEPELFSTARPFGLSGDVTPEVFERALNLATQLAAEGREGRPVGLIFVLGDSDTVLSQTRNLVLNPFRGYPESERNILDPALEETMKEFAALDGAFVIRGDGVVLTGGGHLIPITPSAPLPKGLGTRHGAAAAITASSRAVAIVVSQSTGTVTVFQSGAIVTDIRKPVNGHQLAV